MDSVYLDHNSTAPLLPQVAAAMAEWQSVHGNPASQHHAGRRARQALEQARDQFARMLGARTKGRQPDRVIFTSGGTEANNLAILGSARRFEQQRQQQGELIISAIEHPSVSGPAEYLEQRGWRVHRLPVSRAGAVDVEAIVPLLNERTCLVSVMLANNETGVLADLAEIVRRVAPRGIRVHTDAAQMVGKLPLDFASLGVDLMTVAPHKFHGPLGTGALVTRHDVDLEPLVYGGFQQAGSRPGTEGVALAVGAAAALVAWQQDSERTARLEALRDRFERGLQQGYAGRVVINGSDAPRLPQTSNVAFLGLERQSLLMALDLAGVACSAGSACASGSSEPSSVLTAMGVEREILDSSLRFSLGATTSTEEIDGAVERIVRVGNHILSRRSPSEPVAS